MHYYTNFCPFPHRVCTSHTTDVSADAQVIHVTVSPMLGYVRAAEFAVEREENMTTFSSFIEFSFSGLKVKSALPWSCDVPGTSV